MSPTPKQLFIRKYSLQVTSAAGDVLIISDDGTDPVQLRIVFDVTTSWWRVPWYADISIYNLNEQTANFLLSQGSTSPAAASAGDQKPPIQQGMQVTLQAGYKDGNYGVIWDGIVLQPLWERENQTDFKLTLHCMNWLGSVSRNSVGMNFAAGYAQQDIVKQMAAACFHPIAVGAISDDLSKKKLIRGRTVFGSPRKYLSEIARDNNAQWWVDKKGLLNVSKPGENLSVSKASPTIYTPTTGIVGTPQQTQDGVNFRILLDPTVEVKKPAMCVQIDNAVIRQALRQAGVLPSLLSQDGVYVVFAARYLGDTRGQEWYTDVVGWLPDAVSKLAAGGLQIDG